MLFNVSGMSKFLLIGDLHLRSTSPEMRTDPDFQQLCLGKLEWILNTAERLECDAILQPGDFFDSPNPTSSLLIQTIGLLRSSNVPIITTVGNHDVVGKNTDLYKEQSPLGILEAAGVIDVLVGGDNVRIGDTIVSGYGYGEKITHDFLHGKAKRHNPDIPEIALVHASVGNSRQEAEYDVHELTITPTTADYVLFGDIHFGWELCVNTPKDVACFNPGAVIRLRSTEKDIVPKCYYLDTTKEELDVYEIPHQPSKYAFNIKEMDKRTSDRVEAWNAAQAKSQEIQSERAEDIVRRVAEAVGYDSDVVEIVLDRLAEVKK